jgi:hypothetical protein
MDSPSSLYRCTVAQSEDYSRVTVCAVLVGLRSGQRLLNSAALTLGITLGTITLGTFRGSLLTTLRDGPCI